MSCAGWVLPNVLKRGDRYISTFAPLAGPLKDLNLLRPSLISQLRGTSGSITISPSTACKKDQSHLQPTKSVGMHPSSMTSTPFSVKDILKLEHHHDYESDFLMTDQVVPMHHQHVYAASRSRDFYDCHPEPCVSGAQDKLDTPHSAADEEINEQGEMINTSLITLIHSRWLFVWS